MQVDILTVESLEHNDKKVKYYTGLPNVVMLKVSFDMVTSVKRGSLTTFQEIFMILALRLDLEKVDLARSLTYHNLQYVGYFISGISLRLCPFIQWPDRAELQCQ